MVRQVSDPVDRKPRDDDTANAGPMKLERYSEAFLKVLMDDDPDEGG